MRTRMAEFSCRYPDELGVKPLWRFALLLVAASLSLLQAQGTKTREDPGKYRAHAQIGSLGIAADLLGHYIPLEGTAIRTNNYLVVEVALFAPPNTKVAINSGQFALKVNGQLFLPQSPGLVTVGYVVPDMRERRSRLEADAGVGPVIVSAGRDPVQTKFPGDTNPADSPLPPRSNGSDDALQRDPVDPVKAVSNAALPEGSHATPISGYLFYAYTGKLKRIKHAEIEYTSPTGAR
jgi:hypothetical protein